MNQNPASKNLPAFIRFRFTFDFQKWNFARKQSVTKKKQKIDVWINFNLLFFFLFFGQDPPASVMSGDFPLAFPDCMCIPAVSDDSLLAVRHFMSHYGPAAAHCVSKRSAEQHRGPAVQPHFNHPLSVHPISTGDFNGTVSHAPDCPQRACKHGEAGFTCALVFAAAPPNVQTFYVPGRMFRWRSASRPDGFALNVVSIKGRTPAKLHTQSRTSLLCFTPHWGACGIKYQG